MSLEGLFACLFYHVTFDVTAEVVALAAGEAPRHVQDRGADPQAADDVHAATSRHADRRNAGQTDALCLRSAAVRPARPYRVRLTRVLGGWTNTHRRTQDFTMEGVRMVGTGQGALGTEVPQ